MQLQWHIFWPFDPSFSNDRTQEQSNWAPEDRCITIAQGPLLWQCWWLYLSSPGTVLRSSKNKSHCTKYLMAIAKLGSKQRNRKFTPMLFKEMHRICFGCPGTHSFRSTPWIPVIVHRSPVGPRIQNRKSRQRIWEDSVNTVLFPSPLAPWKLKWRHTGFLRKKAGSKKPIN